MEFKTATMADFDAAFDYIVKGQEQTGPAAARCLEAIHGRLMEERRDPAEVFSLRMGEEIRHVPLEDILFFETGTKAHHVLLHTAHSRMDFVGSLNELEAELAGMGFVRIHQSFLINMRYIGKLGSYVMVLTTGKEISVPKSRYPEVKRQYTLFKGAE